MTAAVVPAYRSRGLHLGLSEGAGWTMDKRNLLGLHPDKTHHRISHPRFTGEEAKAGEVKGLANGRAKAEPRLPGAPSRIEAAEDSRPSEAM